MHESQLSESPAGISRDLIRMACADFSLSGKVGYRMATCLGIKSSNRAPSKVSGEVAIALYVFHVGEEKSLTSSSR
eukprot:4769186-Pleurochrysis_carterae.AAC.4